MNWYGQLPPISTISPFMYGPLPDLTAPPPLAPRAPAPGHSVPQGHNSHIPTPAARTPNTQTPNASPRRKRKSKVEDEASFPINYGVYPVPGDLTIEDPKQAQLMPSEIKTLRYATGIDDRNFITVYEYAVGDHAIIWDYFTGYVHLTGIWKALGNSKADIVRLLDGSPELEQVFRRVRGGFLKIQGTWVPYDIARSLSLRFCYPIRYALIHIFGPDFPERCLRPHDKGYGQLRMRSKPRRRSAIERKEVAQRKARALSAPLSPPRKLWDRSASLSGGSNSNSGSLGTSGLSSTDCAIDTSDDESDVPCSPPPMPRKLSFAGAESVLSSPPQFVEMLQATRSLQQLSSGGSWSTPLGGDFEVEGSGRRYVWDGDKKLSEAEVADQGQRW